MASAMRARLLLLLFVVMLAGCANAPVRSEPLDVVATIAPLADWTRTIGGNRVEVEGIVPVGIDPRAYEPTEAQREQIIVADIVLLNGLGVEPWIDDLLAQGQRGQIILEMSQFIRVPAPDAPAPTPTPLAGLQDEAPTPTAVRTPRPTLDGEMNRYLWLDPRSAIDQVDLIARTLTRADGGGFSVYRQNATRYNADIENVDTTIRRQIDGWPANEIRSADRFLYPFTRRYDIRLDLWDLDATSQTSGAPVFVNRFSVEDAQALPANAVVLNPLGNADYETLMTTLALSMTDAMTRSP